MPFGNLWSCLFQAPSFFFSGDKRSTRQCQQSRCACQLGHYGGPEPIISLRRLRPTLPDPIHRLCNNTNYYWCLHTAIRIPFFAPHRIHSTRWRPGRLARAGSALASADVRATDIHQLEITGIACDNKSRSAQTQPRRSRR